MFNKLLKIIREAYQEESGFIPLHAPVFMGKEKEYLNECIDSTFVSSVGKFVDLFEEQVASYTNSKFAVACVNGTNAIHISLELLGVKNNDLVLTQPLTFVATANAIKYAGAEPVFIDIDENNLGMSPEVLATYLKENTTFRSGICYHNLSGKKIAACVPVHVFGHSCRIDEILEICNRYNIPVLEDAAESIGSKFKGRHAGTIASIGVLSFNGNKTITTGGGGIILTDQELLGKRAKHLTTTAKVPHPYEYFHDEVGYNYRMPNINAALGVAQMEKIGLILENKRKLASYYANEIKALDGVNFFVEPINTVSNYWLNTIVFNDPLDRVKFLEYANANGVQVRPSWKLMNELPMYKNCYHSALFSAQFLVDRMVNIPSSFNKEFSSK